LGIASASLLMTELLCGTTRRQADAVYTAFRHLMTNGGAVVDEGLDKLILFATVRGRPSRITCVMLAWTDTTERTPRHLIV
jgi:NifU-like protein involved in Fe-S cluster formation